MDRQRVLLVEDEKNLAFNVSLNLRAEGFDVVHADNGRDAIALYETGEPFAVMILDVMIPYVDGFEVARHIRRKDQTSGILMLTARASEEDRVRGLSIGVDDYLTKPFHLAELVLRVKRMAERARMIDPIARSTESKCDFGPFTLWHDELLLDGPMGRVSLTSLEAQVLGEFMKYPDKTLTREYLLSEVWGISGAVETRTVDNFIARLRKVLEEEPTNPRYLLSVRGKGYRLQKAEARKAEQ